MKALPWLLASGSLFLIGCGGSDEDNGVKENLLPRITLQSNSSAKENTIFTLSATATDPDGTISAYAWQSANPEVEFIRGQDQAEAQVRLPAVTEDKEVLFSLSVTDNQGESAMAESVITVVQVAPEIAPIPAQTAAEKSQVSIGAEVMLESGTISQYQWRQTSGPQVSLGGADTDTLEVTLPEVDSAQAALFELRVTDDDGDEATTTAQINITQSTLSLTVNGLATDAPLANANIVVMLNGEDYLEAGPTDSQGNFGFELVVDDSMADAFVSIRAKGTGDQAAAGLISLLSNFNTLMEKSGDDGVLDASEEAATTVSNVTTAKYALLKRAADTQNIFTEEAVKVFSEQVNAQEVFTLATAIKVAIDKASSEQTRLPADIVDTLALIEDATATDAFVTSVVQTVEFAEARQEIIDDPTLFATTASFDEAFAFYHLPASDLQSFSPVLHFFANGTGREGITTFSWLADGATLQVTYDGESTSTSYPQREIDGVLVQVREDHVPVTRHYTLITENATSQDYLVTYTSEYQYPETPQLATEPYSSTSVVTVKQQPQALAVEPPAKVYITLPSTSGRGSMILQDDEEAFVVSRYEAFILNQDGTGLAELTNQAIRWSTADDALVIQDFSGSHLPAGALVAQGVAKRRGLDLLAVSVVEAPNTRLYEYDAVVKAVIEPDEIRWEDVQIPGTYGYDTILGESQLDAFWIELTEEGAAYTVFTNDNNQDGVLEESEVLVYGGNWLLDETNHLVINRYLDAQTLGSAPACVSSSASCVLYNKRTWQLLNQQDDLLTVINVHDFNIGIRSDQPQPRDVTQDIRTIQKITEVPFDISDMIGR
ncbi:hypothetical protein IT774_15645 [Salinimonas marina]|uniref:Ig-like domain-containing protein n=1 Tax=Salinimonas marina TaxID=2785918 RepID=A0A7S9HDE8_9ALTE|nr:hypothetical protein [Salinimonas marina]QPG05506.1 hypothetical protein IT774_15645 [Salinimonas marina]